MDDDTNKLTDELFALFDEGLTPIVAEHKRRVYDKLVAFKEQARASAIKEALQYHNEHHELGFNRHHDCDFCNLEETVRKEIEAEICASEREKILAELEEKFGNYWAESYLMGQLYDYVMTKKKED